VGSVKRVERKELKMEKSKLKEGGEKGSVRVRVKRKG